MPVMLPLHNAMLPAYNVQGVFFMCRKRYLHGCCTLFFGLGVMVGYCLESWFLCSFGSLGLIIFGLAIMRRK